MRCTSPISLVQSDGSSAGSRTTVRCGQCMSCRVSRTIEWTFRCMCELMYWNYASFVTLTYDDDHLPMDLGLHKWHYQDFLKRLRRRIDFKIKFFMCGEYGDSVVYPLTGLGRPHFHLIIFGLSPVVHRDLIKSAWPNCDWRQLELTPRGRNAIGTVTFDSVKYVAGYIQKKILGKQAEDAYLRKLLQPPFQSCSGGFGLQFVLDNADRLSLDCSVRYRTYEITLPRYFVDKLHLKENPSYNQRVLSERFAHESSLLDEFYELSSKRGFSALNSREYSIYKADRIPEITTVQRDNLIIKQKLFQRSL